MKTVATHNGTFHADDVFSVATLELAFASGIEILRTRDEIAIATAGIVVDVGGVYDEHKDRFDHHQRDGAGVRPNGVPYASFGLVWKKYGLTLCGNQTLVDEIDQDLVQPIDAEDNGIDLSKNNRYHVYPFSISSAVHVFNPTWREEENSDKIFLECVALAKSILERIIARARDKHEADKFVVKAYESAKDKRLIILDNVYPARDILKNYPEPLFMIRLNPKENTWNLETVKDDPHTFKNRKDLPQSWGGKTGPELQKITGVKDAIFCHRNLFLAKAGSKNGAVALAKLALQ